MTYWQTQHFKALQRAWYKRLEEAGFVDAEEIIGEDLVLKQTAAHYYQQNAAHCASQISRDSQQAYYQSVGEMVRETVFTSSVDQLILSWHAEGKKIKHICEELKNRGTRRCRNTVTFRIRHYVMMWGIRTYTQKQLNKKVS